jgi:hypothetical protein
MSDEELNGVEVEAQAEAAPAQAEVEAQSEPSESQPAEMPKLNGYEKRISTLVHRERKVESENAQLKAELETLKAMQNKEPEKTPEFPSDDLRYDNPDKYREQLEAYNRHVAREEFNNLQRQNQEALERQKVEEQQKEQQAKYQTVVENYIQGGLRSGLNEDKMMANEHVLQGANLSQDLVERIYSDEYGAKLVDHIASDADLLSELSSMNPFDAAVKIATEIKPRALSTKPLSTNAPDPIEPTQGGGMPPSDGLKWIGGAKFE